MTRIFLCYANEDKTIIYEIYKKLQSLGFEPWMDKVNLLPGQIWQQEIPKALKSSDFIFIFFSRNSVSKYGYIQREFKLALDTLAEIPAGVIHTIPIKLDDCEIPERFHDLQWGNLLDSDGFERIVQAIQFGLSQRKSASLTSTSTVIEKSFSESSPATVETTQYIDLTKLKPGMKIRIKENADKTQTMIDDMDTLRGLILEIKSVELPNGGNGGVEIWNKNKTKSWWWDSESLEFP